MNKNPWDKFYKTSIWRQLRASHLARFPLCARCLSEQRITQATVVHHKIAHKGSWELFTDASNLESLCKRCHDSVEQSIERRGHDIGVSDDGWPKDMQHPFNRKR